MKKAIHILRHWIVLVVVFLFPILFIPVTPDFYQTNKLYVFIIATLLLGILWFVESLIKKKATFVITNTTKGLLVLAVAVTIATLIGTQNRVEALLTPLGGLFFTGGFFFLLFSQQAEGEHATDVKTALLSSLILLAIVTIYHASGITNTLVTRFIFLRDPLWSPSGSMLTTLVLFLASIPLFAQLIAASKTKGAGERIVALVLPAAGLFLIVLASGFSLYQIIKHPVVNLSVPASVQIALTSWRQTQHAIAGVGLASYISAFAANKPVSLNQTSLWNTYVTSATGLFTHFATTTGIIGLAALLFAWISPLFVYRKGTNQWGTLGSYFVLTLLLFLVPPTLPFVLFWITLLLLMEKDQEKGTVSFSLAPYAAKGIASIITLLVIIALGYALGRSYLAYLTLYQSLKSVDQKNGTAAYQWAVTSLEQNPYLTSNHLYFSQINLELAKSLATKEKVTEDDRNTITSLISQSISEAKKAIAMDPISPVAWVNLGRIYETLVPIAQGADQWAIASYQQAAIYDPTSPLIRFALGAVSVTRKDYDGSLNYFTQAASLKPDFANAYYNIAYVFKLKGDVTNETAMLQKVLSYVAKDSTDYTKVMNELADLDRQKAASAAAEPSQATKPQPELSTPPSGQPIIVPPLPLPTTKP